MRSLTGMIITMLILAIACGPGEEMAPAYVEDIVTGAPDHAKMLLENDNLAAIRITLPPQAKLPTHPGRDRVVYSLSDYKLRFTPDGGTPEIKDFRKGDIHWHPAGRHAIQNVGPITAEYLVVASVGPNPTAGVTSNLAELTPDRAKVIFENEKTKVIDVVLEPGEKQPEHDAASRLIYSLTAARLGFFAEDVTTEVEFAAGDAHYHQGGKHAVANLGEEPVRYLVVELM